MTTPLAPDLTVIMATFNQPDYLEQCMDSFLIQKINFNVEILIGVDGCEKTKKMMVHNKTTWSTRNNRINTKVYYFNRNSGPFVVKNSLSELVQTKYILFFDSDDILTEDALQKMYDYLKTVPETKLTLLSYVNFQVENGLPKVSLRTRMGEGVFLIETNLFRSCNGFYPWRFGADSELQLRLRYKKYQITHITFATTFLRRIHDQGLSINERTGFNSPQRLNFMNLITNKKRLNYWPEPPSLTSDAITYEEL